MKQKKIAFLLKSSSMRALFVFFITISMTIYLYQIGREEWRRSKLDVFYSKEFKQLFSQSSSDKKIEKLENYMFKDGYNWNEITTLKNEMLKNSVREGDKARFDLATLRFYLDPSELKPLLKPYYLEKLHKQFRNLFKDGYDQEEIQQLIDESFLLAQTELYTNYDTPVEISDQPNWSFIIPHPD